MKTRVIAYLPPPFDLRQRSLLGGISLPPPSSPRGPLFLVRRASAMRSTRAHARTHALAKGFATRDLEVRREPPPLVQGQDEEMQSGAASISSGQSGHDLRERAFVSARAAPRRKRKKNRDDVGRSVLSATDEERSRSGTSRGSGGSDPHATHERTDARAASSR